MKMKARNIHTITGLIYIIIIVNMVNMPFTTGDVRPDGILAGKAANFSNRGFKPVPDGPPQVKDGERIIDNILYKEWCKETFENGNYIYEAYKNIAFNITYTPEPNKTDFWQTPIETDRQKKGDCEDSVIHFFSQLPPNQKNAEIVWGWAINNQTAIGRAHVWYQLTDRRGQVYIVEGFSNDWNGIIPMYIIQEIESRKPIFKISHCMVNRLSHLFPEVESWQMCQTLVDLFTSTDFVTYVSGSQPFSRETNIQHHLSNNEFFEYPANMQGSSRMYTQFLNYTPGRNAVPHVNKEISNILKKLHKVFTRYERQKKEAGANM